MWSKLRNTLFVCACLALCLSAIAHKAAMILGVRPVVAQSYLEGRAYQRLPRPSLDDITGGTFQDEIEQYVADSVPARDAVVLANARVQRGVISLSNALFGFDAYPTRFGSGHVYVPEYDAVAQTLSTVDSARDSYLESHDTLAAFAERHPELSVYVLEVDEPRMSSANPTHELVTGAVGTQEVHELILDGLPGNMTVVGHDITSTEELFEAYYRTDHHWRTAEGYRSYEEALAAMKPGEQPAPILATQTFDLPFYGSLARSGLCTTQEADVIEDLQIDAQALKIRANNKKASYDAIDSWDRFTEGVEKKDQFENLYATYFHGDYALLRIGNAAATTKDSLLLVGNSYLNCIERFFAHNYAHVYKIDGRHTHLVADDILANHPEIRDVLIVGQPAAILTGSLEPAD